MKSIRFTRDVAVHAIHREQGSVHEFEDQVANMLIADGCGVAISKPEKPTVETAEAPTEKRENAMKQTRKKAK